MKKYRLFYDPEKMENFINKMSSKGYGLTKISGYSYEFVSMQPGYYKYKVDFLNGKNEKEIENYISFIKNSGIYFVARSGKIVIFAKESDFQLYTDIESKVEAYKRTKNHFLILMLLCVLFLFSFALNIINCYNSDFLIYLGISILLLWFALAIVFTAKFIRYTKKIKMLKKDR